MSKTWATTRRKSCAWRDHAFRLVFSDRRITVRECRSCGVRTLVEKAQEVS